MSDSAATNKKIPRYKKDEIEEEDHDESSASLGDSFSAVIRELQRVINEAFGLVAEEGRLAALSLILMLGFGLAAMIFVVSSWFLLCVALAAWLLNNGMMIVLTLSIIAAVNLLLAIITGLLIYHFSKNLLFRVSRRNLFNNSMKQRTDN